MFENVVCWLCFERINVTFLLLFEKYNQFCSLQRPVYNDGARLKSDT